MQEIKELFDRFVKNAKVQINFRNEMYKIAPEKQWENRFTEYVDEIGDLIMDNCKVLMTIEQILGNPFTNQDAEALFEQSVALYEARSKDYRLLIPIYDVLIPYYEERKDYDHLARLYLARNYELNEVKYRQFSIKKKEQKDIESAISLMPHYLEMKDQVSRCQIWVAYYIKIVIGLDAGAIRPKEAFAVYDEMMLQWNRSDVQKLDGDCDEIKEYVNLTKKNLTDAIYSIDQEDEETRKRFCQIARENYFLEYQIVKNEFEMDPVAYAGYLYNLYINQEKPKDEIFGDLMDFYKYGVSKYEKEDSLSFQALEFMINITRVLFAWSKKQVSKEKSRRMYASFISLAETTWKQVDEDKVSVLGELMEQLCHFILTDEELSIKSADCIYKMTIQRNFFSYIHAKQVKKLMLLLFDEAYERMPSLFAQYAGMAYEELKEFVENCANIHDVGIMDMIPFRYGNLYPMSEEEEKQNEMHPILGAKFIDGVPSLSMYQEVILGHHKYYDGSGGYPKNYDNTVAYHRIITDILFMADTVDTMYDPFLQHGKNMTFEAILQEFHDLQGIKYNPMLVEVVESSKELQDRLLAAVSSDKYETMFEYYQDLENMMIHQDIDEFVDEVTKMVNKAQVTKETDELVPYLDRLFEYAAKEHSDYLYGKAYYLTMYYHNIREEYMNAINCGIEAGRYFEKLEEYRYLAGIHNYVGLSMQCQGNPENGIGHFLEAIEYAELAKRQDIKGIVYNNLANIFRQLELYEKAVEYYLQAEECLVDQNQYLLPLAYNLLYSYVRMDQKEKVEEYWKKIEELKDKTDVRSESTEFSFDLYEAYLADYYGDENTLNARLEKIASNLEVFEEYRYYIEDINLYMDLLLKLGRFNELIKQLDIYIEYCRGHRISHYVLNSFLQKRIMCAHMVNDFDTSRKVSAYLGKVIEEQQYSQAEVTTQIENAFLKDIKRQSTRKEIIDENVILEKKVLAAKNASEAKTAFLSSMSHEIRTPIHAVIGLNEMILRESKEEQIKEYAKDIQAAGDNLLHIINDVLDFSKMEAGKVEIIAQEYAFADLLNSLYEEYLPKAQEKNIELHFECDDKIPELLYGDMPRIKQILQNLISNGIKFTEKGEVRLIVSIDSKSSDYLVLMFCVKDTGIGVKKDEINKLLKPFERADESRNSSIEGTGLGLSIVNMMVNKMDGHFDIESEYGSGSQFKVLIPQKAMTAKTIKKVTFDSTMVKKSVALKAKDAKILVVDDNAVNLRVVTSLLKRTQIKVDTARSGYECLELTKNTHYDIIFLDHLMPEMDGLETLKKLKEQKACNLLTPVIAMTANSDYGALEFYTQNGFQDYLAKPVDFHVMEAKIRQFLPKELIQE